MSWWSGKAIVFGIAVFGVISAPGGGSMSDVASADSVSAERASAPVEPFSCFVATETLSEADARQVRIEREAHLAVTFSVDSIYRDLVGSETYTVPTDLEGFWPAPVPIATVPDLARYGNRIHPIFRRLRWHNGLDVVHPVGVPVQSLAPGTVVAAGSIGGYGNTVVIDHGDGFSTVSAHLSAFTVSVGEVVTAGQVVGRVGRTGRVTGPHLHFETRLGGVPVDPHWFIKDLPEPRTSIASQDEAPFQIQRLYQQAFGRLPDAAALEFWVGQCRSGRTLAEVATWITAGEEFAARFGDGQPISVRELVEAAEDDAFVNDIAPELIDPSVRRLYLAVLGREPDASGGYYWTARYRNGESLVSLAELIGNSPEYATRFGVTQTDAFVEQTYRLVFGRGPDAEGLEFWVGKAEATSRWYVLVGFAESPEGQSLL